MKLVAFDGDDTLWEPLDGINLSDRTPTDDIGFPDFSYIALAGDPLTVRRDDGPRFALRPEASYVLSTLNGRGVLVGVVSYNHESNVRRILQAFGVLPLVDYVVAEWHSNKDEMLVKMLTRARQDGHAMNMPDVTLIDDDPASIYKAQCKRIGAWFSRFGVDIHDLTEVLELPQILQDSAS